jgi:hypothetical protein
MSANMVHIDAEALREFLLGLTLADHSGDVGREIRDFCRAIGEEEPIWDDHVDRWTFSWEVKI